MAEGFTSLNICNSILSKVNRNEIFFKEYNFSLQRQFQTVVSDLKKSLKKYNCACLIQRRRNSISVNITGLDCDVYRLLNGDETAGIWYRGEYMSNYSWAEVTAGYLAMKYGYAKIND